MKTVLVGCRVKEPSQGIQRWLLFCSPIEVSTVSQTSETQSQAEQPEATTAPAKRSSRKSILAFAVAAIGINTTAAVYTMSPSDFALPNIGNLAELIPHQSLAEYLPQPKAFDPQPDPVVAALKDIQSAQQQHIALLQENNSILQRNAAQHQQDSITLESLRQSVTDDQGDVKKISTQIANEHEDVKKISAQITKLTSKIDSLQSSVAPEFTSSIQTGNARHRLSRAARKKIARQPIPEGPISLGGAPLSVPATAATPQS